MRQFVPPNKKLFEVRAARCKAKARTVQAAVEASPPSGQHGRSAAQEKQLNIFHKTFCAWTTFFKRVGLVYSGFTFAFNKNLLRDVSREG